jgi:hypothetical protein
MPDRPRRDKAGSPATARSTARERALLGFPVPAPGLLAAPLVLLLLWSAPAAAQAQPRAAASEHWTLSCPPVAWDERCAGTRRFRAPEGRRACRLDVVPLPPDLGRGAGQRQAWLGPDEVELAWQAVGSHDDRDRWGNPGFRLAVTFWTLPASAPAGAFAANGCRAARAGKAGPQPLVPAR